MSDIQEQIKLAHKRAEENDIKLLKEELEELRADNYAYHQLMKMENEREYRSKFLKEFQEEFGKNVFPDYDEIYKRYDKLKKENKKLNSIINDKKERQDIAIRLLHKLFGTDDYEINYIIGIINGDRQIKFDDSELEKIKGDNK